MELLTIPEVSRRLKLGRSTTYLLCQRGAIPTVKFPGSRSVRVPEDALEEWIRKNVRLDLAALAAQEMAAPAGTG